jgi:hypothetical protein
MESDRKIKEQGKNVYKAEFGGLFGSESLRNNRNGVRKPLESFFIKSFSSLSSFFIYLTLFEIL